MKALMIAGDRSGSGKTSITLALAALFSRSMVVQTFKVGMDYIDPSYLAGVTGRPCRNLDTYVMDEREIRQIFDHGCRGCDLALVEGVRGLYEGAEALGDVGSSAAIAKMLDLPIILVVSARSITRSAAAIVQGFQAFDPGIEIAGVILNNISGAKHAEKAITAIEHHCRIPVLGAIPRQPEMELTMRHLGLVPYLEGKGDRAFHDRIGTVTRLIGEHVDTERFLSAARHYDPGTHPLSLFPDHAPADLRIGVALDEAFNFYYADLFDVLKGLGATTVPFSPIHDRLPDVDGYIIGGGYPELFLKDLESNIDIRTGLRDAALSGIPMYAECGGLMYLTDRMTLRAGWQGSKTAQSYEMCGVFPGKTIMPARRIVSYVEGQSSEESPLGPGRFRGHEFHYSEVILSDSTSYAYRLNRGQGIRENLDGAIVRHALGSYTHLHPVSSRGMLGYFTDLCRQNVL